MMTVSVDVPDMAGLPESLMTIGTWYSFCCSRSKDRSDDTMAIPSPFAPSIQFENEGVKKYEILTFVALRQRTGIMFDFKRGADFIVGVRIQTEVKRRSVALGPVVIIRSQDLNHFTRRHVFRKYRSVILQ